METLVLEIRHHRTIAENELLAPEIWSKKSFKECSRVIGDTLLANFSTEEILNYGTTISYKTLETIFKQRYILKSPLDRRCLITLTKLVKFLGYQSWADFTKQKDTPNRQNDQVPIPIQRFKKMAN